MLTGCSDQENDLLSRRKKVSMSYLYGKILMDHLTDEERALLATVIKGMAKSDTRPKLIVWSETMYIDLREQEPPENF